jgi:hypothetical protein
MAMDRSIPQKRLLAEKDPWEDLEFIPYVVGFSAVAAVWRRWREKRRGRPRLRDRLLRRQRPVGEPPAGGR